MRSETRTPTPGAAAVLLCVLAASSVYPAAVPADPPPAPQAGETRPAGKSVDAPSQQASGKGAPPQPVEPFVPSETISADSAVAFPVDI